MSNTRKIIHKDPEYRKLQSKRRKEYLAAHPEALDSISGENSSNRRPEVRKKISESMKRYRAENPDANPAKRLSVRKKISDSVKLYHTTHPDFRYSVQNPERAKKCSNSLKLYYSMHSGPINSGYGKGGHVERFYDRKVVWLRSSYEIRFAGILSSLKIEWEYEKHFHIESLNTTYRPDFYLYKYDLLIEVKGWWWPGSKQKIIEFNNQYPNSNLIILYKNDLELLEYELFCYAPIDLRMFGINIVDQIALWNEEKLKNQVNETSDQKL